MKSIEKIVRESMKKKLDEILNRKRGGAAEDDEDDESGDDGDVQMSFVNRDQDRDMKIKEALLASRKMGKGLLVDDIDTKIGGRMRKSTKPIKEKKAQRGDNGVALMGFLEKVRLYRERHPNVSYREAQKIVSGK
jgi:hypothetical protein